MKKIAITGYSFRFPGTTPEHYWADLIKGKNLVTEVESSRWAMDTFRHPNKKHGGTSYTFASGTLGDVSGFDAAFFGISPREAAQMDPQQRLLLELTWEAFENAGIKPAKVRGSKCGVFIGISTVDYAMRFADDLGAIDSTVATGNTSCIAANRISYAFDLKGPSMSIDTACSSSLVAFHQACQSIAVGETTTAIAGGVSLLLHPYGFIAFSKASMLSKKGTCSVFDAAADGYVRSEGGGVFLLKEYEQALADGDPILAVVAGTNVNSDGKKSGLTVPSTAAQSALLTEAYAKAGISASDISYLEAHGTGTPVGDPIEASALSSALGQLRAKDKPLLIGSIKSNLGHMEAASGVAGLVKALHCIKHRTVPASIHFKNPNPNIPFDDWNLKVVSQNTALPATGRIVVGINGFGFGGTNAHIILESHVAKVTAIAQKHKPGMGYVRTPLFLSGKTEAALKDAARQYALLLRQEHVTDLYDISYSAAHHRQWHEHRAVVFGGTPHAVSAALSAFAEGRPGNPSGPAVVASTCMSPAPKLAFVYSGNGSQWEGMGRRLLVESPVFKAAVQMVERFFEKYEDFSLEEELNGKYGQGRFERTEIAQPALFAIQVGVTEMLRSQGLMPSAVTGHSVGEVAAAWAAGALTLEQAVKVIYYRSHFQGMTKGQGEMTAVALSRSHMQALLEETRLTDSVAIASINSARGVTLAGPTAALARLELVLAQRQVVFKRLELDYAFHSAAMDPIQSGVEHALAALAPQKSRIDFVSTVTADVLPGNQLDAHYWWRNIRQPVQFEVAIGKMLEKGIDVFVEIGPHAVLRGYLIQSLKAASIAGRVVTTLTRGDDAASLVWRAASEVMLSGAPVDLSQFFPHAGRFTALPNYAWQRERHWQTVTSESYQLLQRSKVHPLLGYRLGQQELTWENQIDPLKYPELADHVVSDSVVFPGAAYAELGLAAAAQWAGQNGLPAQLEIEELEIQMFMVLSADSTKLVRVHLEPGDGSFTISSRDQFGLEAWTVHAIGRVRTEPTNTLFAQAPVQLPERQPDFAAPLHAQLTQLVGLQYGPAFQAIDIGWTSHDTAWARLQLPAGTATSLRPALLHPALLDCGFQLVFHLLKDQANLPSGMAYLPTKIGRLSLRTGMGLPTMAKAQLVQQSPHSLLAHFSLFNAQGEVVAFLRDVRFRAVPMGSKAAAPLSLLHYSAVPVAHPHCAVPVPLALEHSLREGLQQAAAAHGTDTGDADGDARAYADAVEPLLAALCTSFAVDAFAQLADPQQVVSAQALGFAHNDNSEASAMLGRLVKLLDEDQLLDHTDSSWKLRDTTDIPSAGDIWNTLLADHPDYFAASNAVSRVGLHLAALVRGQTSLAQLLPLDCSYASLVAQSFGAVQGSQSTQALLAAAHASLAQLGEGERLQVVEVGNGAPAFCTQLLRALPADRCSFTFATSDPETLAACQRQAEQWPALALTDLRQAAKPADTAHTAQLVLMHNDFTTLADTEAALDFAARKLASGASLVWLSAPPARWLELLFGPHTPLQAGTAHWQQALAERGVRAGQAIAFLPASPSTPYALLGQGGAAPEAATAIATTTAASPAGAAQPGPVWLVLADGSAQSRQLAALLRQDLPAHGAEVLLADPALDLCDASTVAALLADATARHGTLSVVHLYGLAGAEPLSPADMLAHQLQRTAIATALVQACEATQTSTTGWLVTAGAATRLLPGRSADFAHALDAPLYGLGRTLLNEPSYLDVRLLDLEPTVQGAPHSPAVCAALLRELLAPDAEREVLLTTEGARFAPRLRVAARNLPAPASDASSSVRLSFATPGQLRHLRWTPHANPAPEADQVVLQVAATGLNFRDVMYSLGMLSDEAVESGFAGATLGLECSGVVTALGTSVTGLAVGDRVLAFGSSCFSNVVTTRASAVARMPANMSFEAAATIPTTFFTAYYAMQHLARLQKGERILIHGAAGGVGIAAIQIAKHLGAEVFATAGSDEKRDFLRLMGVDHIFDSRSLAFADQIMAVTQGAGIDVVLNSLAGEAVNRNLALLKPFGRFLELGKRDFYENTKIGLRPFRNNVSYFGIDADQLLQAQPALTETLFKEVLALFAQGVLHPLPFQAYEADDVVNAFRQMQQARHIGKVVVTYRHGINHVQWPRTAHALLQPGAEASYLVTGGLGGFGLKTAQWLASKGARHLVLISRSGAVTPEALSAISALQAQGVTVTAQACDVTNLPALTALFAHMANTLPPLRGVVHAAAVIDDALARNTSAQQLEQVLAPKVLGARHLHELSRTLPLDFYVLYSSATTLFGNPGQGAYVAANAYLEALSEARRSAGLPALCVRWGAIDDVGFLARNEKIRDALQSRMGGKTIQSADALNMLEELLAHQRSDLGVMELDWGALSRFLPSASEPKFAEVAAQSQDAQSDKGSTDDIQQLIASLSPDELSATFKDLLKAEIGEILRIAPDKIDTARSVYDMGLDSLMGVELMLAIEGRFGVQLPLMALSESPTINKLTEKLISLLTGTQGSSEEAEPEAMLAAQVHRAASQHAVDVNTQVIKLIASDLHTGAGAPTQRIIQ